MSLSLLVVPALAAALIGAFRSFRAALLGGVLIGIVEGMVSALEFGARFRGVVPFLVILIVLLWVATWSPLGCRTLALGRPFRPPYPSRLSPH
jgi:branched-subunit amino acid ABC-type transport system permease component